MPKSIHAHSYTSLPSCFRSTSAAADPHSMGAPPPRISAPPNLTTTVYNTHIGIFSLTWSRTVLGRSLHLSLLLAAAGNEKSTHSPPSSSSPLSFHLQIRPFFFWSRIGSKKLNLNNTTGKNIRVFWDFSKAKFGSRPEPESGYYISVVVDGEMSLLAGDSPEESYARARASKLRNRQIMVLRREHVFGNKIYTTQVKIGGKNRDISIDCRAGDDPRLYFTVDRKRVLQVKHLKWKFRGNERIEVDGVHIQVSWDVYNWLFEDDDQDGYALFMFRFDKQALGNEEEEDDHRFSNSDFKYGSSLFESQQSCGLGFEKKKMKKRMLRTARSSSSSSLSSASSGCSSVMEWESVEENELKGPSDFSLLVYAWKS